MGRQCGNYNKVKNKIIIYAGIVVCTLTITGCLNTRVEDDPFVFIEQEEDSVDYNLAVATIEDVVSSKKIKCTYRQVKDEQVSFSVSGRAVSEVYVKQGDKVKKGQLLAELISDIDEKISDLQYSVDKSTLLLKQAKESKQFEIDSIKEEYSLRESTDENRESLKKDIEEIKKNYEYNIQSLGDSIEIDRMRFNELKKEEESGYLYATMSGTISYLKDGLLNSTSQKDEKVITIIDSSQCVFSSTDLDYKDYFAQGQEVELSINIGEHAGTYKVVPYKQNSWSDEMEFLLADDSNITLEVGTSGEMVIILNKKEQVLAVPQAAIHVADNQYYVYVLGENNIREVQYIETGLFGNDYVEVKDGLAEGDKVIVK